MTGSSGGGLPAELAGALGEAPDAEAIFNALRPAEREEYAQYVREAKKPETRVRRGAKVVELVRQRDRRRAELKARGKAPITRAVDEALSEVIAGDLKVDGFAKRGRIWTRDSQQSHRIVRAEGHWTNRTTAGRFYVSLAFAYPGLGVTSTRADGAFIAFEAGHFVGYQPPLEFNDAEDPADRDRVKRELRDRWDGDFGHAFLLAADDPRYLLRRLLDDGDSLRLFSAIELGEAIGDRASQREGVARYLEALRDDALVPDPRLEPNAMGWMVIKYAKVIPHLRDLGIVLADFDRARARDAVDANVTDLREGGNQVTWYRLDEQIAELDDLVRYLDLDVDVAAEVERGRALYKGPYDVSALASPDDP